MSEALIQRLKESRANIWEQGKALLDKAEAEGRDLNAEEAASWQKINGDIDAVDQAIAKAKAQSDKPTLICCKTVIGKGSPNKAGSHDSHGAPLGADEIAATRAAIGWNHAPFEVPADVYAGWNKRAIGADLQGNWDEMFAEYAAQHPQLAQEFLRRMAGEAHPEFATQADAALAEIAALAVFLCRREAHNITGAAMPVDGGWTAQ